MKILEIIMEAKPDNLGQGLLDKIFAVYQKRDINDTTIPKFSNGLDLATHMFKFSGPQKLIWTAKQYVTDQQFFLHDLEDWKNIFDLFDRPDIKQRLDRKDINQYKSIDELKSVIQPLVQQRENMTPFDHILKAVDKFVQKGEAEWLFHGPNYSIYHPISFYSSSILKERYQQVSVCTVTGKDQFNLGYSPNGYLIYILQPNTFFVAYINQTTTKRSEFSDKQNNHTSYKLTYFLEHFPELIPIIKKVSTDSTNLEVRVAISSDDEKYNVCLSAVKQDGEELKYVPKEMRDYRLCTEAVKQFFLALPHVPMEHRDAKMCRIAIEQDGSSLKHVPTSLPEYEQLCLLAVNIDSDALRYVPYKMKTADLCEAAILRNPHNILEVPVFLPNYRDLCLLAVSNDGGSLGGVAASKRSYDICETALLNTGTAIQYVPTTISGYEKLCMIALQTYGGALKFIPKQKLNYSLYKTAIGYSWNALQEVPTDFPEYEELCLLAIKKDFLALIYIPIEKLTSKMCRLAVNKNNYDFIMSSVSPIKAKKIKSLLD